MRCYVCNQVPERNGDLTMVGGTAICIRCLEKSRQRQRSATKIVLAAMLVMFVIPALVCAGCFATGAFR